MMFLFFPLPISQKYMYIYKKSMKTLGVNQVYF